MDSDGEVEVDFLNYSTALLEHLNKHRVEGKFCDISIHVQEQIFKAHKAVLAASSRYFHDQLLLSDSNFIVLPDVLNPAVFEKILASAYTGKLSFSLDDIGSYLTLGSFLQMWHVVDKCNEFLKRGCLLSKAHSSRSSENQSPSSSNFFGCRDVGESWGSDLTKSCLMGKEQPEVGAEHHMVVQSDMNQNVPVQTVCIEGDSGISEGGNCSFKPVAQMPIDLTEQIKQELPDEVMSHRQSRENQKGLNTVPSVGPLEQLMNIAEIRSFSGLDFGASSSETSDFSAHSFLPEGPAEVNEDSSLPLTAVQSSRSSNQRGTSHLSHGPVEHTSRNIIDRRSARY
ncbi:zinc finger and BTB domain-containing protein 22-like isoform X2 [Protopterus annectens]|uniref:zinc finger and BTB domain-containing protein 22-like isoform X2 n=1 Tax=Protopterus annectens TaxID=7888 RepID=UPI001CFA3920|nr:zinc finger and BTB domain-containing protein 22-like isoform X2 [Protopterus annectens]